jgi:hypothetical protein
MFALKGHLEWYHGLARRAPSNTIIDRIHYFYGDETPTLQIGFSYRHKALHYKIRPTLQKIFLEILAIWKYY